MIPAGLTVLLLQLRKCQLFEFRDLSKATQLGRKCQVYLAPESTLFLQVLVPLRDPLLSEALVP